MHASISIEVSELSLVMDKGICMEPDIAFVAGLVGEPARASMLTALMGGKALTATELALEADITAQTASTHRV